MATIEHVSYRVQCTAIDTTQPNTRVAGCLTRFSVKRDAYAAARRIAAEYGSAAVTARSFFDGPLPVAMFRREPGGRVSERTSRDSARVKSARAARAKARR